MNVAQSRGRGTGLLFLKSDASRLGTPEHRFNRQSRWRSKCQHCYRPFRGRARHFILGENLEQSAS